MLIGKYLQQKRKEKGWSQEEFAKMIGVKRGTYAAWEQSRNSIEIPMVSKVSEVLAVTPDEILKNIEDLGTDKHLFKENFHHYGNTNVSSEIWEAKQQECIDLREHNKDLKLLVETQQKMVDTQQKLIERLEYQMKPSMNTGEKEKVGG